MEFWIQKENDSKFQLPVKPTDFTINVASKNTTVNVINIGDINLIGKTGLREITLSSFFPAKDYNFSNNSNRKTPITYVNKIEAWRKSGEPIRVVITDILNMECTIESFAYGEQDATGDIYYTLALKEYKKVATKKATVSVSAVKASTRATQSSSGGTYTVQSGDTLWGIAKKFYGNGSLYMTIYNANTDKLTNPNVIRVGQVLTIPAYSGSTSTATSTATSSADSTSGGGSKTNPPFVILTKSYSLVKANITTWNEVYGIYRAGNGSGNGWRVYDKDKNPITM